MNRTSGTVTASRCPLCGAAEVRRIQEGLRGGQPIDVVECERCTLVYLWPPMTDAEETAFYRANGQWTEIYGQKELSLDYMFKKGEPDARRRLPYVRPYLKPTTRYLDIGCGYGNFLKQILPFVREAVGIEVDSAKIRFVNDTLGVRVLNDLQTLMNQGERFDVISLFHVLEHVKNPSAFLKSLRPLLAPDGIVLAEVPNIKDPLLTVYRIQEFKRYYFQVAHVIYFSPRTVRTLAGQSDYDVSIQGIQRYGLMNHWNWLKNRKPLLDDPLRTFPAYSKFIDRTYRWGLAHSGICDTLFLAFKPR